MPTQTRTAFKKSLPPGYHIVIDEKDPTNPTPFRFHLFHEVKVSGRVMLEEIFRPSGRCFRNTSTAKTHALWLHTVAEQEKSKRAAA